MAGNQGAIHGNVLGEDPLFPLAANIEQQRVMELLRTEVGVVVQGPPGTGKTHTIANLVSALLARGQRTLVTSQKDQDLRVLRDKIPGELRHLCVLLSGGSRGAAAELRNGLDAFSTAYASADRSQLRSDAAALVAERDEIRRRISRINREVAELREIENRVNGPAVAGYSSELYRGSRTQIVRDVSYFDSPPTSIRACPPSPWGVKL